jgi:hypothetical protein
MLPSGFLLEFGQIDESGLQQQRPVRTHFVAASRRAHLEGVLPK